MTYFILGLFIGTFMGMVISSLMNTAARAVREMKRRRGYWPGDY